MRLTKLHSWASRLGMVAAAIASVATSPAVWSVDAMLPPQASPPAGKAFVYTIDSSDPPTVDVKSGGASVRADVASGPGSTSTVVVYAGQTLSSVTISGLCNGGCSNCDPPSGAHATVSNPQPVPAWSLSDTATVANALGGIVSQIAVTYLETGSAPVRFAVAECSIEDAEPDVEPGRFNLYFASCQAPSLTVTASIDGTCEADPCTPPSGQSIHIASLIPSK